MKNSSKEKTLQWIVNQHKKGNISFNHKLQRPIGQWNPKTKSLLIHSILSGFPVNPIYTVEENGVIYTLDGSQRTSTCIGYVNNEFALHKDTPNVKLYIVENGERLEKEYVISGKKFNKLDKEVQDSLISSSLTFCQLSEYTDDEVKEMFKRQNSGKPLSGKLIRITEQSDEFSDVVYLLANHPFMSKVVTKSQRKNGADREFIIQTFMLMLSGSEESYVCFSNKAINDFIKNNSEKCIEKADDLHNALDKLDEHLDILKIPATSIPMVLYSACRVLKDKKSFTKLVDIINEFLNNYDTNSEYKKFVQSGTSSQENVSGRFTWWKNKIKSA